MHILLEPFKKRWECPSCGCVDFTYKNEPNRMHDCPGLGYLTVPMVTAGVSAVHRKVEREDYLGEDAGNVTLVDGRPIMMVQTETDTGIAGTVYAPVARMEFRNGLG